MIGPADEYPIHQIAKPVAWPLSSDRNFYDRSYHNLMTRSGDLMVATGMGYYSNLGTKDAYVVIRRGDLQIGINLSDAIDQDRLNPHVGNYRVDVINPLRTLRIILEETEGVALDVVWEAAFPIVEEPPHVMRRGTRAILEAQRFSQMGTYRGMLAIDGDVIAIDSADWFGFRDRSWGIRPVGEPEPTGAPHPFEGIWMVFAGLMFDDFAVSGLVQEKPDGYRLHNDFSRIDKDGHVELLGWPEISIEYSKGSRYPRRATMTSTLRCGQPLAIDLEVLTGVVGHLGGGYGGAGDWAHGTWNGLGFTQRAEYDLTDASITPRVTLGSIDHTVRATWRVGDAEPARGWGLWSHATIGPHQPSGFADWGIAD